MDKVNIRIEKEGLKNILEQFENDLSSNSFIFKEYKGLIEDCLYMLKDVKNTNKNKIILNKIIEYSNKLLENNDKYKANKVSCKKIREIYEKFK